MLVVQRCAISHSAYIGNTLMPYQHTSHDLTVGSNALVGRVLPHQLRYLCDVRCRRIYDGWLDQRSQFADSDAAAFGLLIASESLKSANFGTSALGTRRAFIPTVRRVALAASTDDGGSSPDTA